LPTTTASDWKGANHSGSGSASSRGISTVVEQTNWGKFEPAIKRWEAVLGRPAPEPTKPDGKENAHRLSSRFTEWMMGVPEGWITDVGLSRNDELKACGNGVVPQQAELALRILLEGVSFDSERGGGADSVANSNSDGSERGQKLSVSSGKESKRGFQSRTEPKQCHRSRIA